MLQCKTRSYPMFFDPTAMKQYQILFTMTLPNGRGFVSPSGFRHPESQVPIPETQRACIEHRKYRLEHRSFPRFIRENSYVPNMGGKEAPTLASMPMVARSLTTRSFHAVSPSIHVVSERWMDHAVCVCTSASTVASHSRCCNFICFAAGSGHALDCKKCAFQGPMGDGSRRTDSKDARCRGFMLAQSNQERHTTARPVTRTASQMRSNLFMIQHKIGLNSY